MSNNTLFDAVADRFTALEIAVKLVNVLPSFDMADVGAAFMEADLSENSDPDQIAEIGMVRDGEKIYGRIDRFDDREYEKAEEIAEPITPDELVAESTSILDLIPLFEKRHLFFVLNRNDITHWVEFRHLDKLPAKLCLFSLFLELELEMIRALTRDPRAIQNHLSHLPGNRLEKAIMLCRQKYKEENPKNQLLCTHFIDKKTMFQADQDLSKILPFPSRNSQDKFFKIVEDIRNQIAHGDSIFKVINDPAQMSELIAKVRETIRALSDFVGSSE